MFHRFTRRVKITGAATILLLLIAFYGIVEWRARNENQRQYDAVVAGVQRSASFAVAVATSITSASAVGVAVPRYVVIIGAPPGVSTTICASPAAWRSVHVSTRGGAS